MRALTSISSPMNDKRSLDAQWKGSREMIECTNSTILISTPCGHAVVVGDCIHAFGEGGVAVKRGSEIVAVVMRNGSLIVMDAATVKQEC